MQKNGTLTKIIFIDSQSPLMFVGKESEQAYDARALALAREGDIIITTSPVDSAYLSYWKGLGFTLPTFMHAGPYENDKCLSTLILDKEPIKQQLMSLNRDEYELHFFLTVDGVEEQVAKTLGFSSYVNFNFAATHRNKETAKKLFIESGIPTLPYLSSLDPQLSFEKVHEVLGSGSYLVKELYGSGGKSLNTIYEFSNQEGYNEIPFADFIIERKISLLKEIAYDWQIHYDGNPSLIRRRQQLSENDSFCGTMFPVAVTPHLSERLHGEYEKLVQNISAKGGIGHMSCDILIDADGNSWWSDLNPRKAASHYVCQAVTELMEMRKVDPASYSFHHKHAHTHTSGVTFSQVREVLQNVLDPSLSRFVLVTNPNVIPYGTVDVTAVSLHGSEDATLLLNETFEKIAAL
jgi:hypothetical protein